MPYSIIILAEKEWADFAARRLAREPDYTVKTAEPFVAAMRLQRRNASIDDIGEDSKRVQIADVSSRVEHRHYDLVVQAYGRRPQDRRPYEVAHTFNDDLALTELIARKLVETQRLLIASRMPDELQEAVRLMETLGREGINVDYQIRRINGNEDELVKQIKSLLGEK